MGNKLTSNLPQDIVWKATFKTNDSKLDPYKYWFIYFNISSSLEVRGQRSFVLEILFLWTRHDLSSSSYKDFDAPFKLRHRCSSLSLLATKCKCNFINYFETVRGVKYRSITKSNWKPGSTWVIAWVGGCILEFISVLLKHKLWRWPQWTNMSNKFVVSQSFLSGHIAQNLDCDFSWWHKVTYYIILHDRFKNRFTLFLPLRENSCNVFSLWHDDVIVQQTASRCTLFSKYGTKAQHDWRRVTFLMNFACFSACLQAQFTYNILYAIKLWPNSLT